MRGSLWSLLGSVVSRLLTLVAMIFVARILGQAQFGELGLVQSTVGVAGLMAGIGLGSTATRFVAQHLNTDRARAGRVIALVRAVSFGMVLLAGIALIAASSLVAREMKVPHLQSALAYSSMLMAITAYRGIQNGVLSGLEKFDLIAKLNIIDGLVSFGAMLVLAPAKGVLGALLGLTIGAGATWLVGHVLLRRELRTKDVRVDYRGCFADWRILASFSLPSFLANSVGTPALWLAMVLVAQSDQGFEGLALYNAAYQWHGPIIFLPMILMSVSMPVLVQEWEAGRTRQFRKLTFLICGFMLALSLPLVMGLTFLSPWIMELYGPAFRDGWLLLVLLLVAAPFHGISKIASGALLGMNRAWWLLGANVGWGITLLGVTLWLLPSCGVISLAAAFLVAYIGLCISTVGMSMFGPELITRA